MPAPSPDKLYDWIDNLIRQRAGEDKHPLFEWECLVTTGFRHWNSKPNAIASRMETLLEDGHLARVQVSNHGYVYLEREAVQPYYFQYENPLGYRRDDNWGYVTYKRSKNHENVWRNGHRYLFTTGDRLKAMKAAMEQQAQKEATARQAQEQAEKEHLRAELNKIAPDAVSLLDRLEAVVPKLDQSFTVRKGKEGTRIFGSVDVREIDGFTAFLDILRRGLPDVPRETSTD